MGGIRLSWPAVLLALLAVALASFAWLSRPLPIEASAIAPHAPDLANGERLFHAGGCAACHGENLAGGEAITTDFGTFYAPNISSDPAAGIGGWSDADFVSAMKRGVAPDGRHYYPAFPYTSYARMEITDLQDLKAWLDKRAPQSARPPAHELGFPWNLRRGLGLWKRLYLDDGWVVRVPEDDARLRAGRYLAEAVGHCGECHTPRDGAGGLRWEAWLAGGRAPQGDGRVPNITPHDQGLADWSEKDLLRYLKSGFTPDYDVVGGSMAEVQENLARLPPADLEALAAYLKAVPPRPGPAAE